MLDITLVLFPANVRQQPQTATYLDGLTGHHRQKKTLNFNENRAKGELRNVFINVTGLVSTIKATRNRSR